MTRPSLRSSRSPRWKFTIRFYRDRRRRHRAHIRNRNGRIILTTSEGDGYSRRTDCLRAVCNVLETPKEAFIVEIEDGPGLARGRRE